MNKNLQIDILGIIADDRSLITYRPALNKITGSVLSTIILQQILYWWKKSNRKRFYKFRDKCNHDLYNEGDSWCEELGFTGREFDTAIKRIGFKLGKTENEIKREEAFIIYYRDSQDLTWYDINTSYLEKRLACNYLVINKSAITKETTNPQLLINTKTNAEKASYEPAENESLRKELEAINFSELEIRILLKGNTADQIADKLKALRGRRGIRNPKLYFMKILKADYPSKDLPVISDNGNNGDNSDDSNITKWVVKKDSLTPEERKKNNERISELAGKARKGLSLAKGKRERREKKGLLNKVAS